MARTDQTGDWAYRCSPSSAELESLARECFARLPDKFRRLCDGLEIASKDFAEDQLLDDLGVESEFDLLGVFEDTGRTQKSVMRLSKAPKKMILFRRPILDYWLDSQETLYDIVTQVLMHEITDYFDFADDGMVCSNIQFN